MLSSSNHSKNEKSLNELADRFDYWRKNYNHPERTDEQSLCAWLYADSGSVYIRDYNHFCELAKEIAKKGYKTDIVIPEDNFNKSIAIVRQREQEHKRFEEFAYSVSHSFHRPKNRIVQSEASMTLLNEKSLTELTDNFHRWMKHTNGHNASDAEELLDWLYMNNVSSYIKNYSHFCELAEEIAKKGYKTNVVISEENFNKSMAIAKQREEDRKKFEESSIHRFHRPQGRVVQSASTVAFLDAMDGYVRPGGAHDIYESDLVRIEDIFKSNTRQGF